MGYSLQQLQLMGATPITPKASSTPTKGLTLQQLQAQGAKPVSNDPYAVIKQQPQQSTASKIGGFFKDLAVGVAKPLVTSIARPIQAAVSAEQYIKDPTKESNTSFNLPGLGQISGLEGEKLSGKNLEKVAGTAAQTAALGFGPTAGGALFGAGQAAEQGGSLGQVATQGLLGGALGKGLEFGTELAGKGLQSLGGFIKETGLGSDALKSSAAGDFAKVLNPTTKLNKAITAKIAPEMADRGIIAISRNSLLSKAEQNVETQGSKLEDAWDALPDNHKTPLKPIVSGITDAQNKLTITNPKGKVVVPEGNLSQFQKLGDLKKELISISSSPNAPTRLLNEYRQTLDKIVKKAGSGFGLSEKDSASVAARKTVVNTIRGELAKSTPDIAKINNEFTFWKRINDVLGATIERKQGQATPFGQKIARGAGQAAGFATHGLTGGLEGGFIMQAVEKVLTSTAWDTVSGTLKSKLADALATGEDTAVSKALGQITHYTGAGLEKFGKKVEGIPGAIKDLPKEDIPNTPSLKKVGKNVVEGVKNIRPGLSIQDVSPKASAGETGFSNFKDLSTKILGKLEGRSEVSKQFISDLTNSGDVKQVERDVIRKTLEDFPDKVNVKDFANKVKTELLPLTTTKAGESTGINGDFKFEPRYENITLPSELRGNVANYDEHLYQSPIKTSAGNVHYNEDAPNYFAHSRVEDLAKDSSSIPVDQGDYKTVGNKKFGSTSEANSYSASKGDTRRVIELQSDLFQKGRLEGEFDPKKAANSGGTDTMESRITREKEVAKLEPFRNTWHERVIKEEVKQAAKDGKTKLQFPTGETALKIEGLGEGNDFQIAGGSYGGGQELTPNLLKVGQEVYSGHDNFISGNNAWIVTENLGDGKFKAIPKEKLRDAIQEHGFAIEKGIGEKSVNYAKTSIPGFSNMSEQFDISGKVDQNNPIYKFYEKEVGKYLKNKFDAKLVTDPQGVSWWQVPINKAQSKLPVEAFGAGAIALGAKGEKKK